MGLRGAAALVLTCVVAGCSPRGAAVSLASLVPMEVAGFRATGQDSTYDRETIFRYMDGAGEVYLQYDYRTLFVREFARGGQPGIAAQVFDMGSPSEAFGIFSLEREDEDAGIGQGSEYGGGLLRFWKGRHFVSVSAETETPEGRDAVLAIGRAIASAIPGTGELPAVVAALPPDGLAARRVRYFHGPFGLASRYPAADGKQLGLSRDTDAVLATYRRGETSSKLLLVRYPDEDSAAAALKAYTLESIAPHGAEALARLADGKWTGARQAGKSLAVVFEADSRQDLEELLARVTGRVEDAPWNR